MSNLAILEVALFNIRNRLNDFYHLVADIDNRLVNAENYLLDNGDALNPILSNIDEGSIFTIYSDFTQDERTEPIRLEDIHLKATKPYLKDPLNNVEIINATNVQKTFNNFNQYFESRLDDTLEFVITDLTIPRPSLRDNTPFISTLEFIRNSNVYSNFLINDNFTVSPDFRDQTIDINIRAINTTNLYKYTEYDSFNYLSEPYTIRIKEQFVLPITPQNRTIQFEHTDYYLKNYKSLPKTIIKAFINAPSPPQEPNILFLNYTYGLLDSSTEFSIIPQDNFTFIQPNIYKYTFDYRGSNNQPKITNLEIIVYDTLYYQYYPDSKTTTTIVISEPSPIALKPDFINPKNIISSNYDTFPFNFNDIFVNVVDDQLLEYTLSSNLTNNNNNRKTYDPLFTSTPTTLQVITDFRNTTNHFTISALHPDYKTQPTMYNIAITETSALPPTRTTSNLEFNASINEKNLVLYDYFESQTINKTLLFYLTSNSDYPDDPYADVFTVNLNKLTVDRPKFFSDPRSLTKYIIAEDTLYNTSNNIELTFNQLPTIIVKQSHVIFNDVSDKISEFQFLASDYFSNLTPYAMAFNVKLIGDVTSNRVNPSKPAVEYSSASELVTINPDYRTTPYQIDIEAYIDTAEYSNFKFTSSITVTEKLATPPYIKTPYKSKEYLLFNINCNIDLDDFFSNNVSENLSFFEETSNSMYQVYGNKLKLTPHYRDTSYEVFVKASNISYNLESTDVFRFDITEANPIVSLQDFDILSSTDNKNYNLYEYFSNLDGIQTNIEFTITYSEPLRNNLNTDHKPPAEIIGSNLYVYPDYRNKTYNININAKDKLYNTGITKSLQVKESKLNEIQTLKTKQSILSIDDNSVSFDLNDYFDIRYHVEYKTNLRFTFDDEYTPNDELRIELHYKIESDGSAKLYYADTFGDITTNIFRNAYKNIEYKIYFIHPLTLYYDENQNVEISTSMFENFDNYMMFRSSTSRRYYDQNGYELFYLDNRSINNYVDNVVINKSMYLLSARGIPQTTITFNNLFDKSFPLKITMDVYHNDTKLNTESLVFNRPLFNGFIYDSLGYQPYQFKMSNLVDEEDITNTLVYKFSPLTDSNLYCNNIISIENDILNVYPFFRNTQYYAYIDVIDSQQDNTITQLVYNLIELPAIVLKDDITTSFSLTLDTKIIYYSNLFTFNADHCNLDKTLTSIQYLSNGEKYSLPIDNYSNVIRDGYYNDATFYEINSNHIKINPEFRDITYYLNFNFNVDTYIFGNASNIDITLTITEQQIPPITLTTTPTFNINNNITDQVYDLTTLYNYHYVDKLDFTLTFSNFTNDNIKIVNDSNLILKFDYHNCNYSVNIRATDPFFNLSNIDLTLDINEQSSIRQLPYDITILTNIMEDPITLDMFDYFSNLTHLSNTDMIFNVNITDSDRITSNDNFITITPDKRGLQYDLIVDAFMNGYPDNVEKISLNVLELPNITFKNDSNNITLKNNNDPVYFSNIYNVYDTTYPFYCNLIYSNTSLHKNVRYVNDMVYNKDVIDYTPVYYLDNLNKINTSLNYVNDIRGISYYLDFNVSLSNFETEIFNNDLRLNIEELQPIAYQNESNLVVENYNTAINIANKFVNNTASNLHIVFENAYEITDNVTHLISKYLISECNITNGDIISVTERPFTNVPVFIPNTDQITITSPINSIVIGFWCKQAFNVTLNTYNISYSRTAGKWFYALITYRSNLLTVYDNENVKHTSNIAIDTTEFTFNFNSLNLISKIKFYKNMDQRVHNALINNIRNDKLFDKNNIFRYGVEDTTAFEYDETTKDLRLVLANSGKKYELIFSGAIDGYENLKQLEYSVIVNENPFTPEVGGLSQEQLYSRSLSIPLSTEILDLEIVKEDLITTYVQNKFIIDPTLDSVALFNSLDTHVVLEIVGESDKSLVITVNPDIKQSRTADDIITDLQNILLASITGQTPVEPVIELVQTSISLDGASYTQLSLEDRELLITKTKENIAEITGKLAKDIVVSLSGSNTKTLISVAVKTTSDITTVTEALDVSQATVGDQLFNSLIESRTGGSTEVRSVTATTPTEDLNMSNTNLQFSLSNIVFDADGIKKIKEFTSESLNSSLDQSVDNRVNITVTPPDVNINIISTSNYDSINVSELAIAVKDKYLEYKLPNYKASSGSPTITEPTPTSVTIKEIYLTINNIDFTSLSGNDKTLLITLTKSNSIIDRTKIFDVILSGDTTRLLITVVYTDITDISLTPENLKNYADNIKTAFLNTKSSITAESISSSSLQATTIDNTVEKSITLTNTENLDRAQLLEIVYQNLIAKTAQPREQIEVTFLESSSDGSLEIDISITTDLPDMVTTNLNNPNLVTDIIDNVVDAEQSFRSSPDADFSTSAGQNTNDITTPISSVTLQIPNVEITDENEESVKETIRRYVATETGLNLEDITVTNNGYGSVTITTREGSVNPGNTGTPDSPIGLATLTTENTGLASDIQDTILESDDLFTEGTRLSDVAPVSTTPAVTQNTLKQATFAITPINTDNIDTEFIKERLRNKFVSDSISGEYDIEVTFSSVTFSSDGSNGAIINVKVFTDDTSSINLTSEGMDEFIETATVDSALGFIPVDSAGVTATATEPSALSTDTQEDIVQLDMTITSVDFDKLSQTDIEELETALNERIKGIDDNVEFEIIDSIESTFTRGSIRIKIRIAIKKDSNKTIDDLKTILKTVVEEPSDPTTNPEDPTTNPEDPTTNPEDPPPTDSEEPSFENIVKNIVAREVLEDFKEKVVLTDKLEQNKDLTNVEVQMSDAVILRSRKSVEKVNTKIVLDALDYDEMTNADKQQIIDKTTQQLKSKVDSGKFKVTLVKNSDDNVEVVIEATSKLGIFGVKEIETAFKELEEPIKNDVVEDIKSLETVNDFIKPAQELTIERVTVEEPVPSAPDNSFNFIDESKTIESSEPIVIKKDLGTISLEMKEYIIDTSLYTAQQNVVYQVYSGNDSNIITIDNSNIVIKNYALGNTHDVVIIGENEFANIEFTFKVEENLITSIKINPNTDSNIVKYPIIDTLEFKLKDYYDYFRIDQLTYSIVHSDSSITNLANIYIFNNILTIRPNFNNQKYNFHILAQDIEYGYSNTDIRYDIREINAASLKNNITGDYRIKANPNQNYDFIINDQPATIDLFNYYNVLREHSNILQVTCNAASPQLNMNYLVNIDDNFIVTIDPSLNQINYSINFTIVYIDFITGEDIVKTSNSDITVNITEQSVFAYKDDITGPNVALIDGVLTYTLSGLTDEVITCNLISSIDLFYETLDINDVIISNVNPITIRDAHHKTTDIDAYRINNNNKDLIISAEYRGLSYTLDFEIYFAAYSNSKLRQQFIITEDPIPAISLKAGYESLDGLDHIMSNNTININNLRNYFDYVYSNELRFISNIYTTDHGVTLTDDDLTIVANLRGSNYDVNITAFDPKFTYDETIIYDGIALSNNTDNSNLTSEIVFSIDEYPPVRFKGDFDNTHSLDIIAVGNTKITCNIANLVDIFISEDVLIFSNSYITSNVRSAHYLEGYDSNAIYLGGDNIGSITSSNGIININPEYRGMQYNAIIDINLSNYTDRDPIQLTLNITEDTIPAINFKNDYETLIGGLSHTMSNNTINISNLQTYFDYVYNDKLLFNLDVNNTNHGATLIDDDLTISANYRGYNYNVTITVYDPMFSYHESIIYNGEYLSNNTTNSNLTTNIVFTITENSSVGFKDGLSILQIHAAGNTKITCNVSDLLDLDSFTDEPVFIFSNSFISPGVRPAHYLQGYDSNAIYLGGDNTGTITSSSGIIEINPEYRGITYNAIIDINLSNYTDREPIRLTLTITEDPIPSISLKAGYDNLSYDMSNNTINISNLQTYFDYVYSNELRFISNIYTTDHGVTLTDDDLTIVANLRGSNYDVNITAFDPKFTYHESIIYDEITLSNNTTNSNLTSEVVFNIYEYPPVRFKGGIDTLDITTVGNTKITCNISNLVESFTGNELFILSNSFISEGVRPAHYLEGDNSNAIYLSDNKIININPEYRGIPYNVVVDILMSNYIDREPIKLNLNITEDPIPAISLNPEHSNIYNYDAQSNQTLSLCNIISMFNYVYLDKLVIDYHTPCNIDGIANPYVIQVVDNSNIFIGCDYRGTDYIVNVVVYDPKFSSNVSGTGYNVSNLEITFNINEIEPLVLISEGSSYDGLGNELLPISLNKFYDINIPTNITNTFKLEFENNKFVANNFNGNEYSYDSEKNIIEFEYRTIFSFTNNLGNKKIVLTNTTDIVKLQDTTSYFNYYIAPINNNNITGTTITDQENPSDPLKVNNYIYQNNLFTWDTKNVNIGQEYYIVDYNSFSSEGSESAIYITIKFFESDSQLITKSISYIPLRDTFSPYSIDGNDGYSNVIVHLDDYNNVFYYKADFRGASTTATIDIVHEDYSNQGINFSLQFTENYASAIPIDQSVLQEYANTIISSNKETIVIDLSRLFSSYHRFPDLEYVSTYKYSNENAVIFEDSNMKINTNYRDDTYDIAVSAIDNQFGIQNDDFVVKITEYPPLKYTVDNSKERIISFPYLNNQLVTYNLFDDITVYATDCNLLFSNSHLSNCSTSDVGYYNDRLPIFSNQSDTLISYENVDSNHYTIDFNPEYRNKTYEIWFDVYLSGYKNQAITTKFILTENNIPEIVNTTVDNKTYSNTATDSYILTDYYSTYPYKDSLQFTLVNDSGSSEEIYVNFGCNLTFQPNFRNINYNLTIHAYDPYFTSKGQNTSNSNLKFNITEKPPLEFTSISSHTFKIYLSSSGTDGYNFKSNDESDANGDQYDRESYSLSGKNSSITIYQNDFIEFHNNAGSHHPLAIRKLDENDLLKYLNTDGSFSNSAVDIVNNNETLTWKFSEVGDYTYFCTSGHFDMTGTIHVKSIPDVNDVSNINIRGLDLTKNPVPYNIMDNITIYANHCNIVISDLSNHETTPFGTDRSTIRDAYYTDSNVINHYDDSNLIITPEYRNMYYNLGFSINMEGYDSQALSKKYFINEVEIPAITPNSGRGAEDPNIFTDVSAQAETKDYPLNYYYRSYPFNDKLEFSIESALTKPKGLEYSFGVITDSVTVDYGLSNIDNSCNLYVVLEFDNNEFQFNIRAIDPNFTNKSPEHGFNTPNTDFYIVISKNTPITFKNIDRTFENQMQIDLELPIMSNVIIEKNFYNKYVESITNSTDVFKVEKYTPYNSNVNGRRAFYPDYYTYDTDEPYIIENSNVYFLPEYRGDTYSNVFKLYVGSYTTYYLLVNVIATEVSIPEISYITLEELTAFGSSMSLTFSNSHKQTYDLSNIYKNYPYVDKLDFDYTVNCNSLPYADTIFEQSNLSIVYNPRLRGETYEITIKATDKFTDLDPSHSNVDLVLTVTEYPPLEFISDPSLLIFEETITITDNEGKTQIECNLRNNVITYTDGDVIMLFSNIFPDESIVRHAHYDTTTNKEALIREDTTITITDTDIINDTFSGDSIIIASRDAYTSTGFNNSFPLTSNFALSFWFYGNSNQEYFMIENSSDSTTNHILFEIDNIDNTNKFKFSQTNSFDVSETIQSSWNHVVFSYSDSVKLYVNNALAVSNVLDPSDQLTVDRITFNNTQNSYYNDFLIIKKAISDADVNYIHNVHNEGSSTFYDRDKLYINPDYRGMSYTADIVMFMEGFEEVSITKQFTIIEPQIPDIVFNISGDISHCNLLDDVITCNTIQDFYSNYPYYENLVFSCNFDKSITNNANAYNVVIDSENNLIITADYRGMTYNVGITATDVKFGKSNIEFEITIHEKPPIEFTNGLLSFTETLTGLTKDEITCNIFEDITVYAGSQSNLSVVSHKNSRTDIRPAFYNLKPGSDPAEGKEAYNIDSSNIVIVPEYRGGDQPYNVEVVIKLDNYDRQTITKRYNITEDHIPPINIRSVNCNFDQLSNVNKVVTLTDYFDYPFVDQLKFATIRPVDPPNGYGFGETDEYINNDINSKTLTVTPKFRNHTYNIIIHAYDPKFTYSEYTGEPLTIEGYKTNTLDYIWKNNLCNNNNDNSNIVNKELILQYTEIPPIEFINDIGTIYFCNLTNIQQTCNLLTNFKNNVNTDPNQNIAFAICNLDTTNDNVNISISSTDIIILPNYRGIDYTFDITYTHDSYQDQSISQSFFVHEEAPSELKLLDTIFTNGTTLTYDLSNQYLVLPHSHDLKAYFDYSLSENLTFTCNITKYNVVSGDIPQEYIESNNYDVQILDSSNISVKGNYRGFTYNIEITGTDLKQPSPPTNTFTIRITEKQPIEFNIEGSPYQYTKIYSGLSNISESLDVASLITTNIDGSSISISPMDISNIDTRIEPQYTTDEIIVTDGNTITINPEYRGNTYQYDVDVMLSGTGYDYYKLKLTLNITEVPIPSINLKDNYETLETLQRSDLSNVNEVINNLRSLYDYPFSNHLEFICNVSCNFVDITEDTLTVIPDLRDTTYSITLIAFDPSFTYDSTIVHNGRELSSNATTAFTDGSESTYQNSNLVNDVLTFTFIELPPVRFKDGSQTNTLTINAPGNAQIECNIIGLLDIFTDYKDKFVFSNSLTTSGIENAHYKQGNNSNVVYLGGDNIGNVDNTTGVIYINPEYRGTTYDFVVDIMMSNYTDREPIKLTLNIEEDSIPAINFKVDYEHPTGNSNLTLTDVTCNINNLRDYFDYVYSNELQFTSNITTTDHGVTLTDHGVTLTDDDLTIDPDLRGSNYTVTITVFDPNFTYHESITYNGIALNTNTDNSNLSQTITLSIIEKPPIEFKSTYTDGSIYTIDMAASGTCNFDIKTLIQNNSSSSNLEITILSTTQYNNCNINSEILDITSDYNYYFTCNLDIAVNLQNYSTKLLNVYLHVILPDVAPILSSDILVIDESLMDHDTHQITFSNIFKNSPEITIPITIDHVSIQNAFEIDENDLKIYNKPRDDYYKPKDLINGRGVNDYNTSLSIIDYSNLKENYYVVDDNSNYHQIYFFTTSGSIQFEGDESINLLLVNNNSGSANVYHKESISVNSNIAYEITQDGGEFTFDTTTKSSMNSNKGTYFAYIDTTKFYGVIIAYNTGKKQYEDTYYNGKSNIDSLFASDEYVKDITISAIGTSSSGNQDLTFVKLGYDTFTVPRLDNPTSNLYLLSDKATYDVGDTFSITYNPYSFASPDNSGDNLEILGSNLQINDNNRGVYDVIIRIANSIYNIFRINEREDDTVDNAYSLESYLV